jgi:hypothetical protein
MSKARDLASGQNGVRPFAMQTGSGSASYASSTTATVSITFTVNRFTQTPVVTASLNNETAAANVSTAKGVGATTSGFTLRWDRPTAGTGTVGANWVAIQMTSESAAG